MWSLILASLFTVGQNAASPVQPDSMGFSEVASWPFGSAHALAEDTINNLIFLASGAGVIVLQPDPSGGFNFVSDAIRTHGGNINVLVYDYSRHLLFMGGDNAWLEVWSVSDPSNPVKITAYQDAISYTYSDIYIMDLHLEGNYLFVGYENVNGSSHYVKIFNTINLPNIQVISTVSVPYTINNFVLSNSRLFVNTGGGSFVFDASNLSNPDSIAYLAVGNCFGIVEDTIYYAVWGSWNGIYGVDIYNISNLSNPVLIGQGNFPLARTYHKVRKYGNTIYACGELLDTWDISDLTNPAHMWSFWVRSSGIYDFSLDNGMLLTASGTAGLSSIAFDSLGNPYEAEYYRVPGRSKEISSGGGYVYYSTDVNGVNQIDILNYNQHEGTLRLPWLSNVLKSEYFSGFLYLASDSFFTKIDISDPSNPQIINSSRLPDTYRPVLSRDFAIYNGYAFVASDSGFFVISLSNMQIESRFADTAFVSNYKVLSIHGNFIFLATITGNMGIVNVSNPLSPTLASTTFLSQAYGGATSMAFYNNYAYIATNVNQILVYDVSNPASPTFVTDYFAPNNRSYNLRHLIANGNYLFGTTGNYYSTLVAFDISNPTNPEIAGYYDNFYGSNAVYTMEGNNIYLGDWTIGVHVLHFTPTGISEEPGTIQNPTNQVLVNKIRFTLPWNERLTVEVYNPSGRIVLRRNGEFRKGINEISLNNLGNGVYFYSIKTHNKMVRGKVLVVK